MVIEPYWPEDDEVSAVRVVENDGPLILGQPHVGTWVPDAIREDLNETGRALADTDWHIGLVYSSGLPQQDVGTVDSLSHYTDWAIEHAVPPPAATVVASTIHRYVIDCNRDPAGTSLYPGQNTTGLVPLTDFDGRPIYHAGREPNAEEIARRLKAYHVPYHAALAAQIERVKARHGVAIVYDCHSIRSNIPFLFDGELPVLNIGTNGGVTCDPAIEAAAEEAARESGFTWSLNGRFKGGWTTRHYGRPADGVHAIQMEIAQRAYMDEAPPWGWAWDRWAQLTPVLSALLHRLDALAPTLTR